MAQRIPNMEGMKFNSVKAWDYLKEGHYDDNCLEQFFAQFTAFDVITHDKKLKFLVSKLNNYIKPDKHDLVNLYVKFLGRLIEDNIEVVLNQECFNWVLESLEENYTVDILNFFNKLISLNSIVIANYGAKNSLLKNPENLFTRDSSVLRHIDSQNRRWNEKEFLILNCFNTLFLKLKEENRFIEPKVISELKSVVLETLSQLPINCLNKKYINKLVKICLRLLRLTIDEKSFKQSEEFGILLGMAQAYLFYGIEGFPTINPKPMVTCNLNLPVAINPDLKKKYYRNYKTKKSNATKSSSNIMSPSSKSQVKSTSDSEVSDNETRSIGDPQDHSIRLEATHLLHDLVLCNRRQFTGYWMQIIASGSKDNLRTLSKYIVQETVQANLRVALNTLHELLLASKTFLSHANDIERSSYDSVFYLLGLSIKEIYESIFHLLRKENRLLVLVKAIKCASSLVEATPFSRLKPGLASELAKLCYPFLTHKDNTIRVITYELFETLILSEPLTQEIYDIFSKSSNDSLYTLSDSTYNTASETETEEIVLDDISECVNQIDSISVQDITQEPKMGAIMEMCLKILSINRNKEPVVVRAMMLLRAIAFNAFDLVYPHLECVTEQLIEPIKHLYLEEDLWRIVLQVYRTIEVIAQRLKDMKYNDKALMFWKVIFVDVIFLTSHDVTNLREVSCDCLANIDNSILLQQINVERHSRIGKYPVATIVSALSACINDKESAVRAAAVRAFGMLVTLSALEEDTGFLWDVQKCACVGYKDENLGVRIKAAWVIANLTEVLIKRKHKMKVQAETNELEDKKHEKKDDPNEPEPIDFINILAKPYLLSVSGAKDKDKVRCNAVKAIGNIIYLCQDISCIKDTNSDIVCDGMSNLYEPPEYVAVLKELLNNIRKDASKSLNKDISKYFDSTDENSPDNFYRNVLILRYTTAGLNALIDCLQISNDMKVKWNTCRALGVIISGDPDAILPLFWKDIVFPVLTEQMCTSTNFKVRTNAAWVFTVCKSFGDKTNMVWRQILEAFENSKTLSSINEYQHYEDLIEQLCLAFSHVALYTDFKWFDSLWTEIENYMDSVTAIIKRFQEKVLPEKAGDLIKVKTRFSLLAQTKMNPNEKEFVTKMIDIFANDQRFDSAIGE